MFTNLQASRGRQTESERKMSDLLKSDQSNAQKHSQSTRAAYTGKSYIFFSLLYLHALRGLSLYRRSIKFYKTMNDREEEEEEEKK